MPPERFERLIEAVKARGGRVSTKRNADGTDSPYEMNITYFSAMADPEAGGEPDALARQVRRFLARQALMLSLRGIPGIYFHSLVGTSNDLAGVERTGRARSINRRKFDLAEIQQILDGSESTEAMVLDGYRRLLAARIAQPAFHPDAPQELVLLDDPALVGFRRTSLDGSQSVFVLANVGAESRRVSWCAPTRASSW